MSEILPSELSKDGKRNAYSHHCDKVQAQKNYAVCLHLIGLRRYGALPTIYSDCSAAIGNKACPAIKMRREETENGQAIYFVERLRSEAVYMNDEDFKPVVVSDYKKKRRSHDKSVVTEVKKPKSAFDQFLDGGSAGIGDAINEAIKEKNEDKLETKSGDSQSTFRNSAPSKAQPGESLVEMAKRIMQERQLKEKAL